MSLIVIEANSKKEIKQFINYPHVLYEGDPNYVPELYIAQKEMFNRKKYPFFEYGDVQCFLAFEHGKIAGRIAAIKNSRYNEYHKSNVGFFGFFDFKESTKIAEALLDRAKAWLRTESYEAMIGPTNFTTNETAGFLVDGFDSPPKIMMTYNKPYYDGILKELGLVKEMDLFAYFIPSFEASDKSIKLCTMLETRLKSQGVIIRNINLRKFKQEVVKIKEVYNLAWEDNWGFVPFTESEFKHLADGLKMLADEDFGFIAEDNGVPIGFSISLPNINEITINFKRGRLFPFNIFKLLWNKKKIKSVRVLATGVKEEYRKKGIGAIFFARNILEARKRKLDGGEASWILENNIPMVQAAENLNGKKYKTYRLYRAPLT
ncbi:MAG: hypothetical protein HKN67_08700 [Saprospiraceae bacterium]|nr:hypothetical protein [Bacteroidia bacterium]NNF22007.1 hypothetical protein [Saprospiraceae bacterium]NNK89520.1 hypothetical protein [Saprospiraceae bacterium]